MGGSGSGWRGSSKTTVEDCLILSAAKLMRDRMLRPGLCSWSSLTWTNTVTGEKLSSIGFDVNLGSDSGTARLHYTRTSAGEAMDYHVNLTTTPLPWGGLRWWFTCPLTVNGRHCGRRVGKLYLPPGGRYFGCRRCYDLTYTSCNESHKYDRLYNEIARKMGVSLAEVREAMK
jgi:hypothetical protein